MGLKSSRPLPFANVELEMAPFFKRRFRTWHLDHIELVILRYHRLTKRHCIDSIQLGEILGIKDPMFIQDIMNLFMPHTPTRVHHMIDMMEIVIALILVCQAPSLWHRYQAIFDVMDIHQKRVLTKSDMVVLWGGVTRAMMKIFCYNIQSDQRAGMLYLTTLWDKYLSTSALFRQTGTIDKETICKVLLMEPNAVHAMKQCSGQDKPKLYLRLEKSSELLGAIEFHTEAEMKGASLQTIRDMAMTQCYHIPHDFIFICQGRPAKRVWEADRTAWSVVPFALRGSPGVRTIAMAINRRMEHFPLANPFEFKYMGNSIKRYKKKITEIDPVYQHCVYRLRSRSSSQCDWLDIEDTTENEMDRLESRRQWRVAENWSGEWVYNQSQIHATSKTVLQHKLRHSVKAKEERVVVKTHRGELISSRIETERTTKQKSGRDDEKIQWKARMIAMQALDDPIEQDINFCVGQKQQTNQDSSTTVLVHVQQALELPSRLLSVIEKQKSDLRVHVLPHKLQLDPISFHSNGLMGLGPFLSSTNIELEEDEVEVFPVLVIRPMTNPNLPLSNVVEDVNLPPYRAHPAYLNPVMFTISSKESHYEPLYHYIHGQLTDLILLNQQNVLGTTLLHEAAEYGHAQVVDLLLEQKVLVNVRDKRGDTPLHHAAQRGHLRIVTSLLQAGAVPWQVNHQGKSPLHVALETVAYTMRHTRASYMKPPQQTTSNLVFDLYKSETYTKMRQVIDLLWDRYPLSILTQSPNLNDRIHCLAMEQQVYGDWIQSARQGHLLRLQRLVDLEKRPCAQYINQNLSELKRTALHEAVECGHSAVVDLLIKLGVDVYQVDQRQQLALHIGAEKGFHSIVQCLIYSYPSTLSYQDSGGKTPLHLAIERRHTEVALTLLDVVEHELNPIVTQTLINCQDHVGYTLLHYACMTGNVRVAQVLVRLDCDIGISMYTYHLSMDRTHLLGLYWKRYRLEQAKKQRTRTCFLHRTQQEQMYRIEIESPIEILLKTCRLYTHEYVDYLTILRMILQKSRQGNSNLINSSSQRVLHLAAAIADRNLSVAVEICRVLSQEFHWEINSIDPETGASVLLQECLRICRTKETDNSDPSRLALIRMLIQLGANVNLPNERNGETPLNCAAYYAHLPLIDLLLTEAHAQVDYSPRVSFTSLHFAAYKGSVFCAKRLITAHAASVHARATVVDEVPLFFAIRGQHEAMVELLLLQGADPCVICTLRTHHTTSFGVSFLSLSTQKTCHTLVPPTQASALTLALWIALPLHPFQSQDKGPNIRQSQQRMRWESMRRMTLLIAKRMASSTTRLFLADDVELASVLGYWELVQFLCTSQVILSNALTFPTLNALHRAASAGETSVVIALVAAGMHVNSVVVSETHPSKHVIFHRGPLYFACVSGQIETAMKLLVLGAQPLETLPYRMDQAKRIVFVVQQSLSHTTKQAYIRNPKIPPSEHESFLSYVAQSLSLRVPLLHIVAKMGYIHMVSSLLDAGMNGLATSPIETCQELADTAIHVAIRMGHLHIVQVFAKIASYSFPQYFREGNRKMESLLVTACQYHQLEILQYLLCEDEGGGYSSQETAEEIHQALQCAASTHFVQGFLWLIQHARARPDLVTLVHVLERVGGHHKQTWVQGKREIVPHETMISKRSRSLAREQRYSSTVLSCFLTSILPFVHGKHTFSFFAVLSYDHIFTLCLISAQYGLWHVLEACFVSNEHHFHDVETTSRSIPTLQAWKPLLIRAASSCMLLHRAAMENQVEVLQFFLRLGIPVADLHLIDHPKIPSPIWYAAIHGALNAFLVLALSSSQWIDTLPRTFGIRFHTITSSSSIQTSTCRWQNMSVMSCYDVSRTHIDYVLIHYYVQAMWREKRDVPLLENTLLHVAAARGTFIAVQSLIQAGANVQARNVKGETALSLAAARKDSFGPSIVQLLAMTLRPSIQVETTRTLEEEEQDAVRIEILSQALVMSLILPCHNLSIIKILLERGALPTYQHPTLQQTSLHLAMRSMEVATIEVLLDHGAKLSIPDIELFLSTLEHRALSFLQDKGSALVSMEHLFNRLIGDKKLWYKNYDLTYQLLDTIALIAVSIASYTGHATKYWALVSLIVTDFEKELSTRTSTGSKVLHYAAQARQTAIVERLLSGTGMNVSADRQDENHQTPLHVVARHGDTSITALLLTKLFTDGKSERVDATDRYGRTPLHVAIIHGHDAMVAQLIQFRGHSPSISCFSSKGWNAFTYAAKVDQLSILMALYERDSSRQLFYTQDGEHVIFIAAQSRAYRVVHWLLSITQHMETQTCHQGRSLLHYAAMHGNLQLVQTLITTTLGRTVNQRDKVGYTPLMYAFAYGQIPVLQILLHLQDQIDVTLQVEHPLALSFTLVALTKWFALPGWYPHVQRLIGNADQPIRNNWLSGYRIRRIQRRPQRVWTSLRTWRFPVMSLLDYACDVGDTTLVSLCLEFEKLGLVPSYGIAPYTMHRRSFLQAVRWNRLDIVDHLLHASTSFTDYIEVGVDCAVSRGLETMTLYLLKQWNPPKDLVNPTQAFIFQFANAVQMATIRGMKQVLVYMMEQGNDQEMVLYEWKHGSTMVYAMAFGHTEIVSMLGSIPVNQVDPYMVPSCKKWIEMGGLSHVAIAWIDPLMTSEESDQRLSIESMETLFGSLNIQEKKQEAE